LPITISLSPSCPPGRDNSDHFILVPFFNGVRYEEQKGSIRDSYSLPAQFTIHDAILLNDGHGIVEDFDRVVEVDPMLAQVALGFVLVPLK
jgi:hypothetical protein